MGKVIRIIPSNFQYTASNAIHGEDKETKIYLQYGEQKSQMRQNET